VCKRQGCIHSTNTTNPNRLAVRLQKDTVPSSPCVCYVHQQGTRTIPENCGNPPAKSMFLTWTNICYMFYGWAPNKPSHFGSWRENKEYCTSHSTSVTLLTQHNNPFPLFLEQYIPFTDDAVPLNVHISALSRNPGAFRRQYGIYFTVTHCHNFCSPFSLYQKITPSIGFHDWSSRATPGTPASV